MMGVRILHLHNHAKWGNFEGKLKKFVLSKSTNKKNLHKSQKDNSNIKDLTRFDTKNQNRLVIWKAGTKNLH